MAIFLKILPQREPYSQVWNGLFNKQTKYSIFRNTLRTKKNNNKKESSDKIPLSTQVFQGQALCQNV